MGGDAGHLVRHIQKGKALEAAGMGGQKGGGQGAALQAHHRQDRHGHGQRAAAKAGHIVNRCDTGRKHGTSSSLSKVSLILSHIFLLFKRESCAIVVLRGRPVSLRPPAFAGAAGACPGHLPGSGCGCLLSLSAAARGLRSRVFLAAAQRHRTGRPHRCGRDGAGSQAGFRRCCLSESFMSFRPAPVGPKTECAPVMELVDMRDLGSRAAMRVGSSPFRRTRKNLFLI